MSAPLARQIAVAAAQRMVEDGLETGAARHLAAQAVGGRRLRRSDLPDHVTIEDEVHAYIATFHADSQPLELRALRELALHWMKRLQAHRPHLAGSVWRGTATRRSAILIDLYCDDPKGAEIELVNQGVAFDSGGNAQASAPADSILTLADRSRTLNELVTIHLLLHDHDDLRGALRPDARGRSWRGSLAALQRSLDEGASALGAP